MWLKQFARDRERRKHGSAGGGVIVLGSLALLLFSLPSVVSAESSDATASSNLRSVRSNDLVHRHLTERKAQLGDSIGDVVSSWNHTNHPTANPTTSTPPSPAPTRKPSRKPTRAPTVAPTVSRAPTEVPSHSPSDTPSRTPSKGPTAHPTVTRYPTVHPSASPSIAPSSSPSIPPSLSPTASPPPSQLPSAEPSQAPSTSPSTPPTLSPTFVGTQSTFFQVTLPFDFLLNKTEIKAFVQGTEDWIPQAKLVEKRNDGTLSQATVEFEKQTLVTANSNEQRRLQETNSSSPNSLNTPHDTTLSIEMRVSVVYKGSDSSFNLYLALDPMLQLPDPLWIHMLGNYNSLFLQLREPSTVPPAITEGGMTTQNKNVNLTSAGVAIIALVVIGAVGLGAVAVSVGMREYKMAMIGAELGSPNAGGAGSEQEGYFNNEAESMLPNEQQPIQGDGLFREDVGPALNSDHGVLIASTLNEIPNPRPEQIMPPSPLVRDPVLYYDTTNENDSSYLANNANPKARGPRDDSIGEIFRGHAVLGRTGSDPPTANSEVGLSASAMNPSRSLPHDYMRRRALMDDNSTRRDSVASSSIRTAGTSYVDQQPSMSMPIQRQRGALPTKDVPPPPPSDAYTASQVSSYYGTNRDTGSGTLGARPLVRDSTLRRQSLRSNPSFDSSVVPRAGLYDVFAPSGPIGIIVDTTKDGPAVHSLKASSPMRGLINPGDLIVALDDKDTRGMTAATLTRLMAKKAHQKERKITLLATDPY